jgi:hypothetical protein
LAHNGAGTADETVDANMTVVVVNAATSLPETDSSGAIVDEATRLESLGPPDPHAVKTVSNMNAADAQRNRPERPIRTTPSCLREPWLGYPQPRILP